MTISMLARRTGVSRTSLLYYESQGLLRTPPRTAGNYRAYGVRDLQRVQQIRQHRKLGLSLSEIRDVLDRAGAGAVPVLERRLAAIDAEIARLREHQRAIVRLLQQSRSFRRVQMMTKDKWVGIMKASGFSEQQMHRWHAEFEKGAPEEHQEFLEFLRIAPDEIARIRNASAEKAPR